MKQIDIYANGFAKSGNHALIKALELLGQPCAVHHTPFGEDTTGVNVFIKRDPRNVLISWLRFQGKPVTPGMFISSFRKFQTKTLVEEMADYEGWLTSPGTIVVKYEDLISEESEMRRIADALGIPYIQGAWAELPGLTITWNEVHSDWTKLWCPEIEEVWSTEGGTELVARWGY